MTSRDRTDGVEAMENAHEAQGGHTFGHTAKSEGAVPASSKALNDLEREELDWRARRDSNPRPIGSKPIALSS